MRGGDGACSRVSDLSSFEETVDVSTESLRGQRGFYEMRCSMEASTGADLTDLRKDVSPGASIVAGCDMASGALQKMFLAGQRVCERDNAELISVGFGAGTVAATRWQFGE